MRYKKIKKTNIPLENIADLRFGRQYAQQVTLIQKFDKFKGQCQEIIYIYKLI